MKTLRANAEMTSPLEQRVAVLGSSGAVLHCRHTVVERDKLSLLIALPFGVPFAVADAAFNKFGPDYNVVTWESRYILNLEQEFPADEKCAPTEHARDMLCILEQLGIATCSLIGYCSGAGISLVAATEHPQVFTDLMLVNGEYQLFLKGHTSTDYQRSIDSFLPVVAASREQAAFVFAKMAEISKAGRDAPQTELDKQINLPFSQEEYLFRYAKNYMAYREFDALQVAARVQQPTYVLTGCKDQHCDMENSEAIEQAIPDTKMFVADEGDHYEFCRAGSTTLEEIGVHLARRER